MRPGVEHIGNPLGIEGEPLRIPRPEQPEVGALYAILAVGCCAVGGVHPLEVTRDVLPHSGYVSPLLNG